MIDALEPPHVFFKATPDDAKRTLAFVTQMTTAFVRRCKLDYLKKGSCVRWFVPTAANAQMLKRSAVALPQPFTVSTELIYLRLSMNEQRQVANGFYKKKISHSSSVSSGVLPRWRG